jgi:tight adherence protein C
VTLILAACFLTLTAAIVGAGYWLTTREVQPAAEGPTAIPNVILDAPAEPGEAAGLDLLHLLGRSLAERRPDPKLESDLAAAGYRHPRRRTYFHGLQIIAGLVSAVIFAVLWRRLGYAGTETLLGALMGAMLGGFAIRQLVRGAAARRRLRIRAALPSALDLLVLGLEAGQPLDLALTDTSRELRRVHQDLSYELSLVPLELRAGNPRADVLTNLARRIGDSELTRLVNVMVDSDRYGTGMGPALRNHARYLRTRRRQSAQEQARKVSVKLVFPVFFLIFPSVLLVTLGPAIISLFTQLIPMMTQ